MHDLFVVTVHLQSWNSVITERLPWAGYLFGIAPPTLNMFAGEGAGTACFELRAENGAKSAGAADCRRVLWDEIDPSRNVANSVLGAITQYILPVLYGFLGAMAATLRLLRRKLDGFTRSYTDRARVLHGAILGILGAAVIGLFMSYIGTANMTGSLGISAFALLAGTISTACFASSTSCRTACSARPHPPPRAGLPS